MNTLETPPGTARRLAQRVSSPRLTIAVAIKNFFGPVGLVFCELTDLGRGGVGMTSPTLQAKLGQRFDLQLFHGDRVFHARGSVTHRSMLDKPHQYGIAFIFAPPELDTLIDLFVAERRANPMRHGMTMPHIEKRKAGGRFVTPDAQVYVRPTDSADAYLRCEVDNVSKGGMGFYCPTPIARTVPFKVFILISNSPDSALITGVVHYEGKKQDRHYYGLEYELVSMELVRSLESLDDSRWPALDG